MFKSPHYFLSFFYWQDSLECKKDDMIKKNWMDICVKIDDMIKKKRYIHETKCWISA